MTEPIENTDPAVTSDENAAEGSEGNGKGNREAARYRTQLRETETALEQARARIEQYQRTEVHRLAGAKLSDPADVYLAGIELGDMLDDNDDVDAAKVDAATDTVLASRPGLRKAARPVDPRQGMGQGDAVAPSTWGDLFK